MKTLKIFGALVLASVMLFSVFGCKKKAKGHDGADSAEELLLSDMFELAGNWKKSP